MIKKYIISLLKENNNLLALAAYCYSIIHHTSLMSLGILGGGRKKVCKGAFLQNVKIKVDGEGSSVYIGPRTVMRNCEVIIKAKNAYIRIEGGGTLIKNAQLYIFDDGGKIVINSYFTMESGRIEALEGTAISIGRDCMFSGNIEIMTGDYHVIESFSTGQRVNYAKNIHIEDHVWLASNVKVLKGSVIAKGCIVGNSSVVSGCLNKENTSYAGIPAKQIKSGIIWRRSRK